MYKIRIAELFFICLKIIVFGYMLYFSIYEKAEVGKRPDK
jgi:hypothetical protein